MGPAPPDRWIEGGGNTFTPRWEIRTDDDAVVNVQEAELRPMVPRGLGPQPGPVECPACDGSGTRAKPGRITPGLCQSCAGAGITYPDDPASPSPSR